MLGLFGKNTKPLELRRSRRMFVEDPIVVSWQDGGHPRQLPGRCLDISNGGIKLAVEGSVPVSTPVRVKLHTLFPLADGVVRHSGKGTVGVEFTSLTLLRPDLCLRRRAKKKAEREKYVIAALGFLLLGFFLFKTPGALPEWVPFAAHVPWPLPLPQSQFTLGPSRLKVPFAQSLPTGITPSAGPYAPLRTAVSTSGTKKSAREYFTVGSTAAEVLKVQGPPTKLREDVWRYGLSEVYFQGGRVIRWKNSPGQPLKVTLPRPLH